MAAVLFSIVAVPLFLGHALTPLSEPLPFYGYPFLVVTLLGTLGLTLAALVALVLTVVRGRVAEASVPRIWVVSIAAILLQLAHFIEETQHQFYVRFPEFLGLASWSREFFLTFNLFWLAAWLFAIVIGDYFSGLWTSPFVGILGVVLLRTLSRGGNPERVLAQQWFRWRQLREGRTRVQ